MRLPPLFTLFCLASITASAQSAAPVDPTPPVQPVTFGKAVTILLPPNLPLRNSTCYVIDARRFPQTGSTFNPAAPSTTSTCQPASQYHLKAATALPAR